MGKGRKKSALQVLRPKLDAIPADEVATPPIPVERLIAEAMALAVVAEKDRGELKKAGLDTKLIDEMLPRAEALAEAQAELQSVRGQRRSQSEVKLEVQGVALRSDMVADGRFALRQDRDALAMLDHIQEGEGLDDLVQDLKELATFFDKHKGALERVGAEPKHKAARARAAASDLEKQLANRRAGDRDEQQAIETRNRATTFLLQAVSEVRATGAYVFRRTPRHVVRYHSAYNTQRRARRRDAGTGPTPPPTSAATP